MMELHLILSTICATLVIFSINPIHSVLWLVLVFINTSIILITSGVDFLGLLFIIVYVGAIAVLFLFVVMMLNIKMAIRERFNRYNVPLVLILVSLLGFFIYSLSDYLIQDLPSLENNSNIINWIHYVEPLPNIQAIGNHLYTSYYDIFVIVGMVLLLAMVGAIMLTHVAIAQSRRQDMFKQLTRETNVSLYKKIR